ncbi:MFS transporter [Pseudomonas fluorescens]|uniref:Major facilitator superfamily (MFS) profile domain-containing protein n=1 Tax=Pseudomonas fluorescens TaxID=294 RepID=A0A5E7CFK3_PSEFL|nr:MFS transporter [Pseudomonas fluorescens]VVO03603.1 hypothetical protein PS833_02860 [Pseudomonas fluorescens]
MPLIAQNTSGEWQQGWKILVAGFFAMAVSWNFIGIAFGAFIKPMQHDLGWSRSELAIGPIAGLAVAVLLPFVALLIDRVGARKVAIGGIMCISSACVMLGLLPENRLVFFGVVAYFSIGASMITSVTIARGVMPWFDQRLGTAIGIMMTGISVAAALGIPVITYIIQTYGWRVGFFVLAVSELVIGLPLLLLWFKEPRDGRGKNKLNSVPRTYRSLVGDAVFWKLSLASLVAAFPIGGFVTHLQPLLSDRGIDELQAAMLVSVFAVAVGLGRIITGWLFDHFDATRVAFIVLALGAFGAAVISQFTADQVPMIIVALSIGLIGGAQGAEGDYIKYFSMRLFGAANFARVVSVMAMIISIGMALGGIAFSIAHDHFGNYEYAVRASVALYLLGGLMFLTINMKAVRAAAAVCS